VGESRSNSTSDATERSDDDDVADNIVAPWTVDVRCIVEVAGGNITGMNFSLEGVKDDDDDEHIFDEAAETGDAIGENEDASLVASSSSLIEPASVDELILEPESPRTIFNDDRIS